MLGARSLQHEWRDFVVFIVRSFKKKSVGRMVAVAVFQPRSLRTRLSSLHGTYSSRPLQNGHYYPKQSETNVAY